MKTKPKCMGCSSPRAAGKYVCRECWWLLRPWVRTSLTKKDDRSMLRLRELTNQIQGGRPLEDIEVHP